MTPTAPLCVFSAMTKPRRLTSRMIKPSIRMHVHSTTSPINEVCAIGFAFGV